MSSPFKVLEAYGREDREIFFGRNAEIDLLFQKTRESNLVLVYGASGTGKTSLVHCGLPICFSSDDWLPIYIRRKDNLRASILEEVNTFLQRKLKAHTPLHLAIKALQMSYFRPIYLIIDQFEELYVSGNEEEHNQFYDFVQTVLTSEYNCKIILVMREEYLADLSDFEERVPTLFDYRVRVEKMRRSNTKEVILKSADAFDIVVEEPERTADMIVSEVMEEHSLIELTYLQIYLDRLYELAKSRQGQLVGYADTDLEERVVFTPSLVEELSSLGDVLGEYLEEQVRKVQQKLSKREEEQVWIMLNLLASEDGTRISMNIYEATSKMFALGASKENIAFFLDELSKVRIIHRSDQRVELAHDSLAAKIVERRTVAQKNLAKAKEVLQTGLKTYRNTEEVLSKTSLSLIEPHLETLQLSADEQALLQKSKNRAVRSRVIQIVSLLGVILALTSLSIWALRERGVAIDSKNELQRKNEQMIQQLNSSIKTSQELDRQLQNIIEKEKTLEELLRVNGKTYQLIEDKNQEIKQYQAINQTLKDRLEKTNRELDASQETQKKAKADELIAKALLEANYFTGIRIAEAAYQIEPLEEARRAIIQIFRNEQFRDCKDPNRLIWVQAQACLKTNKIPPLSRAKKRQLGIDAFLSP